MDKRVLKQQYKDSATPAGVYWNTRGDRSLVGSSTNLPATLNRHRAELAMGAHRNRELQSDWNALGADAFAFEVLDTLAPRAGVDDDPKGELRVLEELWLERLKPYGERGYNPTPK